MMAEEPVAKEIPNYWRETLLGFTVAFLISLLVALAGYFGLLAGIEGRIQDRIWLGNAPAPATDRIKILTIDDRAYLDFFGASSPLNPAVLSDLVTKIHSANPTVLGVDIQTNPPLEANAKIYRSFAENPLNRDVVWVSSYKPARSETTDFFEWLSGKSDELIVRPDPVLGIAPYQLNSKRGIIWGPAIFPLQRDSKLRRFPRRVFLATNPASDEANEIHHSWARVVAEQYCARSDFPCKSIRRDELYMSFGRHKSCRHSISEFFTPAKESVGMTEEAKDRLGDLLRGNIALLGGTFSESCDFHDTPDGRIAGIFVNARAVASEMSGVALEEMPQPWSFLLDVLLGFSIVLFFAGAKKAWNLEPRNARTMVATSIAVAAITSFILYRSHYIFSPAAVGIGTLVQQLYDFVYKNPKLGPAG